VQDVCTGRSSEIYREYVRDVALRDRRGAQSSTCGKPSGKVGAHLRRTDTAVHSTMVRLSQGRWY
jgi:hypothetical protein